MLALVRPVPASFASALAAAVPDPPIDVARARAQHAAYREAIAAAGVEVRELAAADLLPDSCFVEDTAVVAGGLALVTRPGAPSRRPETEATAAALAEWLAIERVVEPATLDGGDCMRVGTTIFVGRSGRTNDAGIARLTEVFAPRGFTVVALELPAHVLHLKCVCAPLGDHRITLADDALPRSAFGDLEIVAVPAAETYAANVLALGSTVLAAAGYPRTHERIAAAGYRVVALDTSELRKADGALTCLSILV